jgi:hypothetical protein
MIDTLWSKMQKQTKLTLHNMHLTQDGDGQDNYVLILKNLKTFMIKKFKSTGYESICSINRPNMLRKFKKEYTYKHLNHIYTLPANLKHSQNSLVLYVDLKVGNKLFYSWLLNLCLC